jgi:hypothetical protein
VKNVKNILRFFVFFMILSTINIPSTIIPSTEGGDHERVSSLLCEVQGKTHDEGCSGSNE